MNQFLRRADPGNFQSIAAIAYGCGFSDQAQFSRSFRDAYGRSPREYRRMPAGVPPVL